MAFGFVEYRATDFGSFTGFYDWLRPSVATIVGVRYWPFENTNFLLNTLPECASISVSAAKGLTILFLAGANYREELSDDQDFSESQLYSGVDGSYALLLGLSGLKPEDLMSIRQIAEGQHSP
jgi:hypothetical protein